jgi:hypothetical protein
MDLVVVRIHTWPDGAQRIFDPSVPARGEHPGHHHELMMLGDLPQLLGPRSVHRFGDLGQWQSETAHGGLGKDHQLCVTRSSLGRSGRDEFQVLLGS